MRLAGPKAEQMEARGDMRAESVAQCVECLLPLQLGRTCRNCRG